MKPKTIFVCGRCPIYATTVHWSAGPQSLAEAHPHTDTIVTVSHVDYSTKTILTIFKWTRWVFSFSLFQQILRPFLLRIMHFQRTWWGKEWVNEKKCVWVCVCVCEREREREKGVGWGRDKGQRLRSWPSQLHWLKKKKNICVLIARWKMYVKKLLLKRKRWQDGGCGSVSRERERERERGGGGREREGDYTKIKKTLRRSGLFAVDEDFAALINFQNTTIDILREDQTIKLS